MHIAEVLNASLESLTVTACMDPLPLGTAKPGSLTRLSQAVDYAQLSREPDSHWHHVPFEPTLLIERVQRLGVVRWICRSGTHRSPAPTGVGLGFFAWVQPYTNASAWRVWMDAHAQVLGDWEWERQREAVQQVRALAC